MQLRNDFPLLVTKIHDKQLIYFDSAATAQKPQAVIDALVRFYTTQNATVHRTTYTLAEQATEQYEAVRQKIAPFIGADTQEIIFTKGTTESINLVATAWGKNHIQTGDEIVISALEHHSNLLPWQELCREKKAVLNVIPLNEDGTLNMEKARELITNKTKLVAIVHVSNFIGTHVDIKTVARYAHDVGAKILVDAAQSVPHQPINVVHLGVDFCAFSAHKMFGPTGLGILYIKKSLHEQLSVYQVGGGMVFEADYHHATWLPVPRKFEAGTPPIAQVIAFGAALDYIAHHIDWDLLRKHEARLCEQVIEGLSSYSRIRLLGPLAELKKQGHLVSFVVDGSHAHDVGAYLDAQGICVRAGHHCAQPLAKKLNLDSAVRVSFHGYNNEEEVAFFLQVMGKVVEKPRFDYTQNMVE